MALLAVSLVLTRLAGPDRKVAQGILARSARDIPVAGRFAPLPLPAALQAYALLKKKSALAVSVTSRSDAAPGTGSRRGWYGCW